MIHNNILNVSDILHALTLEKYGQLQIKTNYQYILWGNYIIILIRILEIFNINIYKF